MGISRHPDSMRAETECEYLTALRRDVVAAAVLTGLMLAGVAVGASLAARQDPLLMQSTHVPAAEPLQLDYFPSWYVNQGVESFEDLPTF